MGTLYKKSVDYHLFRLEYPVKIPSRLSLYFHTAYKIFQTKTWRMFFESKRLRVLQQSSILLDIYTTDHIIYGVKMTLKTPS